MFTQHFNMTNERNADYKKNEQNESNYKHTERHRRRKKID